MNAVRVEDAAIAMAQNSEDYIRIRLPEGIKEKFKAYCFLKGTTMSDALREYVEGVVTESDIDKLLEEMKGRLDK